MHCNQFVEPALRLVVFLYFYSFTSATSFRTHRASALAEFKPLREGLENKPCNLTQPSLAAWYGGDAERFSNWTDYNWHNYKESKYSTFVDYLKGEFAPNAAPSALVCDGIGSCTIGTCESLAKDITPFDRHMAYYAFEQISNIHHTYQTIYYASVEAGEHVKDHHTSLVSLFTHANKIDAAFLKRKHDTQLAVTIVLAVANIALSFVPGGTAVVSTSTTVQAVAETAKEAAKEAARPNKYLNLLKTGMAQGGTIQGLVNNRLRGVEGLAVVGPGHSRADVNGGSGDKAALKGSSLDTARRQGVVDLVGNLYLAANRLTPLFSQGGKGADNVDKWFEAIFSDLTYHTVQKVWMELYNIMEGKSVTGAIALPDLLKSGAFIERERSLRPRLTHEMERTYLALAINTLWSTDRAYILNTNTEEGVPCKNDSRGLERNRVCLSEHPDRVYWLYTIDHGRERAKHSEARVRTPSGLQTMMEKPELYYNISKQEIVRSSLWVHEQNNYAQDLVRTLPALKESLARVGSEQRPNGIFHLPVCRNPGGEAISSIASKHNRHYPCMCGEFSWPHGWTLEKDETPLFLTQSGLWDSKDWERQCRKKDKCVTEKKSKHGPPRIGIKWPHPEAFNGRRPVMEFPYKSCNPKLHKGRFGKPKKDID